MWNVFQGSGQCSHFNQREMIVHCIQFVSDEVLPEGHDFVFVELPAGAAIFYRESALSPQSLEDSWTAYRSLSARPPQQPQPMAPEFPLILRQLHGLAA
jgi:hypothetical protein